MDDKFAMAWAFTTLSLLGGASLVAILLGYGPPVRTVGQAFALGAFAAVVIFTPLVWAAWSRT